MFLFLSCVTSCDGICFSFTYTAFMSPNYVRCRYFCLVTMENGFWKFISNCARFRNESISCAGTSTTVQNCLRRQAFTFRIPWAGNDNDMSSNYFFHTPKAACLKFCPPPTPLLPSSTNFASLENGAHLSPSPPKKKRMSFLKPLVFFRV